MENYLSGKLGLAIALIIDSADGQLVLIATLGFDTEV